MTVWGLESWAETWCGEKAISKDLYINFRILALAYAEQEIEENYLTSVLKNKKIYVISLRSTAPSSEGVKG